MTQLDGFPRDHVRHPECIEAFSVLRSEVRDLRRGEDRQNGSLEKLVDAVHTQGVRLVSMDEKLSMLIVRQVEDREQQAEDRRRIERLHDSGPVHREPAPAPKEPASAPKEPAGEKPRWWYLLLGAALATGAATGQLINLLASK